ncbi:MAG: T9SS type A sorting domain-containing protein [Candidatus Marinimicrobia bacterium]|nr:T9SS type A sorting domain-containing protein [Candidatus Neomarinimicrobiota bacterium]
MDLFEHEYIFPVDTLFREIRIDNHETNGNLPNILDFYLPNTEHDSIEYAITSPVLGRWNDDSCMVIDIDWTSLSNKDSVFVGTTFLDSLQQSYIRYFNYPGDSLSGIHMEISYDTLSAENDHIKFYVSSNTYSDWRNFQPLGMGYIWRYYGPRAIYISDRIEIIDTFSVSDTSFFKAVRHREYSPGYGEGIVIDTSVIYTLPHKKHQIFQYSGYNILVHDFKRSWYFDEPSYGTIEVLSPQKDGSVDFWISDQFGNGRIWSYGIGFVYSSGDYQGTISSLLGYYLGGDVYGDTSQIVSIEPYRFLTNSFKLSTFPNPFNPNTSIEYELSEHSQVSLTVYNLQGRQIMTLVSESKPAGLYRVQWNGMDDQGEQVSTGIYFARLQAGSYSQVEKMVYLK